jgi:GNAT superfamily N-acetyltransferase
MTVEVRPASNEDLDRVTQLFDLYRIFYSQPSNLAAARNFIEERLNKQDSQILVASNNGRVVGFTQLYPSFSSVSMRRIYILNDLFVEESERGKGIARSLMESAAAYARSHGAIRLALSTQVSNSAARSLYASLNYIKNEEFCNYTLSL